MRGLFAIVVTIALLSSAASAATWRERIAPEDLDRLRRLDAAWTQAVNQARAIHAADLKALNGLAERQPVFYRPLPPPGAYRCRTVKLGSPAAGGLDFVAYGWFACRVARGAQGELTFAKVSGSQRPSGVIYPDNTKHAIFLGAQAWGSGEAAIAYGAQPERDQVGVVERIGPSRWRMALPWPRQESKLDLIELAR